jgi:hypothetical protein
LQRPGLIAKAGASNSPEPHMLGIAVIVTFIVVIGALNYIDFGRLD